MREIQNNNEEPQGFKTILELKPWRVRYINPYSIVVTPDRRAFIRPFTRVYKNRGTEHTIAIQKIIVDGEEIIILKEYSLGHGEFEINWFENYSEIDSLPVQFWHKDAITQYLPENFEDVCIEAMIVGDTGWIKPEEIFLNENGEIFLVLSQPFETDAKGSYTVNIKCTSNGIVIDGATLKPSSLRRKKQIDESRYMKVSVSFINEEEQFTMPASYEVRTIEDLSEDETGFINASAIFIDSNGNAYINLDCRVDMKQNSKNSAKVQFKNGKFTVEVANPKSVTKISLSTFEAMYDDLVAANLITKEA